MPNFIIIEPSQYLRMPWKNGLGETLEIQRHEDEIDLRFRISQASVVEDGMFSDFSGLHRTLVLLSGEGMTLKHTNHTNLLTNPLDMARFSGGDETHATLKNGKIEDLNIMVRDTDTQARVEAYTAPCSLSSSNNDTLFSGFYCNEKCTLGIDNGEVVNGEIVSVDAHSTVIFSKDTRVLLSQGSGVFIQVFASN